MKTLILTLIILSMVSASFAQEERSVGTRGGGGAVVCFNNPEYKHIIEHNQGMMPEHQAQAMLNDIQSIVAYDLYSVQHNLDGRSIDQLLQVVPANSVHEFIQNLARRFDDTIPYIANFLRTPNRTLQQSEVLRRPYQFPFLDDLGVYQLLGDDISHCTVMTIVRQSGGIDDTSLSDWQVEVVDVLYNHPRHDTISKSILTLHEIVYLKGRQLGHTTSANTRRLVRALVSPSETDTIYSYLELLSQTQFSSSQFDPMMLADANEVKRLYNLIKSEFITAVRPNDENLRSVAARLDYWSGKETVSFDEALLRVARELVLSALRTQRIERNRVITHNIEFTFNSNWSDESTVQTQLIQILQEQLRVSTTSLNGNRHPFCQGRKTVNNGLENEDIQDWCRTFEEYSWDDYFLTEFVRYDARPYR